MVELPVPPVWVPVPPVWVPVLDQLPVPMPVTTSIRMPIVQLHAARGAPTATSRATFLCGLARLAQRLSFALGAQRGRSICWRGGWGLVSLLRCTGCQQARPRPAAVLCSRGSVGKEHLLEEWVGLVSLSPVSPSGCPPLPGLSGEGASIGGVGGSSQSVLVVLYLCNSTLVQPFLLFLYFFCRHG